MIHLKTREEIEIMRECGKKLTASIEELLPSIKAGVTTLEIDQEAERLIIKNGAESSFNKVPGYKWSTCICINEQAVHTPPSERVVKDGDILTLDIGAYDNGYHTDYATTFVVGGTTSPKIEHFLKTGRETLDKAIKEAQEGNYLGQISQVMQEGIYGNGYFVMKELTGHGIGHELHEDPFVPNYLDRKVEKTMKIPSGLVIAVEVIYSMGSETIVFEKEGEWSIRSKDKSICACFEHTIAILDKNTSILV
ncbi:MAG: type I methionyl aminopeptidase [Patescibacteria group bacterium]